MKGKERGQSVTAKKKSKTANDSADIDSDSERNFDLLIKKEREKQNNKGEPAEEEEFTDDEEEVMDGDDEEGGEEEEEEMSDEEDDTDSEVSEEDDEEDEEEDNTHNADSKEIQTSDDIKQELSSMSFEDIMKLQNKVGTKVYNEVAYSHSKTPSSSSSKKKRLNKNRPMEISAKKPAPFLRHVVPVKKSTLRDPRFDDLSGEYKPEIFEKTYNFISDIKRKEKEVIMKQLKKTTKNNQRREKLQFLLKRMENQERARSQQEQRREKELEFKRQQRELAKQGLQPFFLKKSEKKKLQLAEKYKELKKSGKLDNFLSKKRKRNAGKDRKKLPTQQ